MALSFRVVRHGVYLGVSMGPDAVGAEFDEAESKYQARCVYIRSIPGLLAELFRAHQVDIVSVLMFIVQVADLPKCARQVEVAFLARALSAPMHSMTVDALIGCTFPPKQNKFVPVDLQAQAAMLRFALVMAQLRNSDHP